MITALEGWTQEIPTPHTTSETKHNPIGVPSIMPGSSAPGFVDPSGDPSGSPSDIPTKYPYPVPTINPEIVPSETTTIYPSRVPKELKSAKIRNMLIEYPSGYPAGATITIQAVKPSSNPRDYTI